MTMKPAKAAIVANSAIANSVKEGLTPLEVANAVPRSTSNGVE